MIILDTNVVSEAMRPRPDPKVLAWLDEQPARALYLTAVTAGELRYGVARLPAGKRRDRLVAMIGQIFDALFKSRVLPYDLAASAEYGALVAAREQAGLPISTADAQIASIARCNQAALATRNLDDFAQLGLELINPF